MIAGHPGAETRAGLHRATRESPSVRSAAPPERVVLLGVSAGRRYAGKLSLLRGKRRLLPGIRCCRVEAAEGRRELTEIALAALLCRRRRALALLLAEAHQRRGSLEKVERRFTWSAEGVAGGGATVKRGDLGGQLNAHQSLLELGGAHGGFRFIDVGADDDELVAAGAM
jgi:hypothetical protein